MFKLLPAQLLVGQIPGSQIVPGSIGTTEIAAGSITTPLLAAGAVTAATIAANTITAGQIAAGTITGTQIAASVALSAPVITGGTITGAQIIADGASGELLAYTGAPATGNLLVSISGAAGSDAHSNAYVVGLQVHGSGTQSIAANVTPGQATLQFITGVTEEGTPGELWSGITNPGTAEVMRLVLYGPQSNVASHTDQVSVWLASASKDGTSAAVGGSLIYTDTSGVGHLYLNWNSKGVRVQDGYGNGTQYQTERQTLVQAAGVSITTTSQTQILATMALAPGQYLIEGQIMCTPAAAGGSASFEFSGGGGIVVGSSGAFWEAILPGGAPYTNLGSSYADPGYQAAFTVTMTTSGKFRVLFRYLINVTTGGTLGLFATEASSGSYTVDSRMTFAHLYPVGP